MADVDWAQITHSLGLTLFGEPNPRLSRESRGELRWGRQGSLKMLVHPDPDAGLWYDHQEKVGGGVLKLLEYALNLDREAALAYLREQGYLDGAPPDAQPPQPDPEILAQRAEKRRREAQIAARRAQAIVSTAELKEHPYLASKGFDAHQGLVLPAEGLLLVPMWNMQGTEIRAVQTIDEQGRKKFQPRGCAVANTAHFLGGRRGMWWWCEGYATGLSILQAINALYRSDDRVVVAFSAGAIAKYAKRGVIVAEHDRYKCNAVECGHRWAAEWGDTRCPQCSSERVSPPAGERAAREAGLPFWKSPIAGEDANDYWRREGTAALADHLRELIWQAQ